MTRDDVVVGDRDGVILVPAANLDAVVQAARTIRDRERHQAALADDGTTLREQFDVAAYLAARERDPARTFRQHLTERAASIEA